MHQRLTQRLTSHPHLNVDARLGDALCLPAPDASIDVVIEHEVLLFTPHPLRAVDEALRVLRPHGRLIRLLTHAHGPWPDPLDAIQQAFRAAASATGTPLLTRGKGTDYLITTHLANQQLITTEHTLACWVEQLTVQEAIAPLQLQALPFTVDLSPAAQQAGLRAALTKAQQLAGHDGTLRAGRRLYALITSREEQVSHG
jgi:SAM-dependent methyltransferase